MTLKLLKGMKMIGMFVNAHYKALETNCERNTLNLVCKNQAFRQEALPRRAGPASTPGSFVFI